MSELLLVNPRAKRRSRRSGPQRMSALQRQYFGKNPRRRRSRTRTRSRRVVRMRRNPTAVATMPTPRRRRFGRARAYVRSMRRRRSGGGGGMGSISRITDLIVPALIGAGGAMALDVAWASLPLPDSLKTGTFAPFTRIGGAIGIGWLVGMVAGKRYGAIAGAGALTVTLYDLAKPYIASAIPSIPGLGYYSPAQQYGVYRGMGVYR